MNSIDSIISKIKADADTAAQEKIQEAQAEAQQILTECREQAQKAAQAAQAAADKEAQTLLERIESQSDLVRRNLLLQHKRAAINKAFDKALELLCTMEQQKQLELLSGAAAKFQTQDAAILLNAKDRAAFGPKLVELVQQKLAAAGKPYKVTLAEQTGSFAGGLVLVEGSIETNISYEVLIKDIRDSIEGEVAKALYA